MKSTQEPNYGISSEGRLYDRSTNIDISDDEPVFILRAQDKHSASAVLYYQKLCQDAASRDLIDIRANAFVDFSTDYSSRMKLPGSLPGGYGGKSDDPSAASLLSAQEPKYGINKEGKLFNRITEVPIPDEEPVFILRGQDKNAALVISYYKTLCEIPSHKYVVNARLHDFVDFAHKFPERMQDLGATRSGHECIEYNEHSVGLS